MNGNCHIALESRLTHCENVTTLGVKPNLEDYSSEAMALIQNAMKIYYPSSFHAELFYATGKETFPSVHNYLFAQDKIKQTAIFKLLGIPHPRTRVFYGKHQKSSILDRFHFPFIAKIPRGSAMGRGVFLIQNQTDLNSYLSLDTPAYIQEYLPLDRDIRIVVIGNEIAHAYWRIAPSDDFRTNVAVGGSISLEPVPRKARELALYTAKACNWNDVGIDICTHNDNFFVIEANMKYGKQGFKSAGIDYADMMTHKIASGAI